MLFLLFRVNLAPLLLHVSLSLFIYICVHARKQFYFTYFPLQRAASWECKSQITRKKRRFSFGFFALHRRLFLERPTFEPQPFVRAARACSGYLGASFWKLFCSPAAVKFRPETIKWNSCESRVSTAYALALWLSSLYLARTSSGTRPINCLLTQFHFQEIATNNMLFCAVARAWWVYVFRVFSNLSLTSLSHIAAAARVVVSNFWGSLVKLHGDFLVNIIADCCLVQLLQTLWRVNIRAKLIKFEDNAT